jgi:hypothetical protein
MDYLTVEEARDLPGLRLALTRGVPGPWSEAAKALFRHHGVDYAPVAQVAGAENPELVEWTRHRNAPVAVYDNEAPRVRWLEILDLAERLGSGTSLVPVDRADRIFMVGLVNEIAGEGGLAWNARVLMLHAAAAAQGPGTQSNPMFSEYRYDPALVEDNITRVQGFLDYLANHITNQVARGSHFLVGSELTAADLYWAYFSNMLEPLPHEQCPMPDGLRAVWGVVAQSIAGYDPILIEHRDRILVDHLELPLSF